MASFGANSAVDSTVAPIVVPPSGSWDGNDGPWSTFNIHVGTPPQLLRVLASTSYSDTIVVSANKTQGGCLPKDPRDCSSLRGGLFNINASSTWHDNGIYNMEMELNLPNYDAKWDNADYGFDALGLGLPGSAGLNFKSQTIGAIATNDFYLGSLGVNPQGLNFTTISQTEISFMDSLKQSNNSPSLSFGYNAGARYRQNTTATLTLGGYDASRITKSNIVSFPFFSDLTRDLTVNLQNITLNNEGNKTLLPTNIPIYIDSTVALLWLPRDSCTLFENAFGLSYNTTIKRYLVDEKMHAQLVAANASVSFLINQVNSTDRTIVNVTLPYSSFDLELGDPIVNSTQRYFPLQRADNASEYTLGRTFLQEAYLIVDYERSNFSISQNNWNLTATPDIVTIKPLSGRVPSNATQLTNQLMNQSTNQSTRNREIAGSTVGACVAVIVCLALIFFLLRRRNAARRARNMSDTKTNADDWGKPEMEAQDRARAELETSAEERKPIELPGSPMAELHNNASGAELAGSTVGVEKAGDSSVVEVKGDDTDGNE